MTIKEEVEAVYALPPDERKLVLQARAERHMRHGDDEDGYNLYILWTLAQIYGGKRATDAGFAVRGRPRTRPQTGA